MSIQSIGLFGLGCVGQEVFNKISYKLNSTFTIKKVCVRNHDKKRIINKEYLVYNKDEILLDPDIKLIIELIDDADAAFEIVRTALNHKKPVISANKRMIAKYFKQLVELQKINQTPLLYEAACGAGIPIIRLVEDYYAAHSIEAIQGIVNGSTNYILSKIRFENISYDQALKQAQQLGFAETQHILDTGGFDARSKLQILISHAFGLVIEEEDIPLVGINRLSSVEFNFASYHNSTVKLLVYTEMSIEGKLLAYVIPAFISCSEQLSHVHFEHNAISVTSYSDTQLFYGKGAGSIPTASAVLADLEAVKLNYQYSYTALKESKKADINWNKLIKVFLRYPSGGQEEYTSFCDSIIDKNDADHYLIAWVNFSNLKKICNDSQCSVLIFQ